MSMSRIKPLFDENLSPKLVNLLANDFPNSNHVELLKLRGTTDTTLWDLAKQQNYIIVSKDNDLRQRVFLLGPPLKVIWLSVRNAGTSEIARLLKQHLSVIKLFEEKRRRFTRFRSGERK
jgi:predicted nuclease of predicted toxin-antitoxin system